jgi:hypothetical protein
MLAMAHVLSLTSAGAQPAVDATTTAMARARFKEGVAFYDAGKFEQARVSFLQAYALKTHPLVLINVALSCLKSGHAVEASRDFRQFLIDGKDLTEKQRSDATDGLRQALTQVGQIEVLVESGSTVSVDSEPAGRAPLGDTLVVEPGTHTVGIRALDGATDTRTVAVGAGDKVIAKFEHAAPASPASIAAPVSSAPPSVVAGPPPQAPAESPPSVAAAAPATSPQEEPKAPEPLPNQPPTETPSSVLPLWPSYVGYVLAAPAIAAALYVGFESESEAETNANVTRSNILQARGACPATTPSFVASCAQYSNDLNLENTDKTIAYALAASGAVLFVASTVWLVVGFAHNTESPTVHSGASAPFMITPFFGPSGAGLGFSSTF